MVEIMISFNASQTLVKKQIGSSEPSCGVRNTERAKDVDVSSHPVLSLDDPGSCLRNTSVPKLEGRGNFTILNFVNKRHHL